MTSKTKAIGGQWNDSHMVIHRDDGEDESWLMTVLSFELCPLIGGPFELIVLQGTMRIAFKQPLQ